jgi:hypothetical protein
MNKEQVVGKLDGALQELQKAYENAETLARNAKVEVTEKALKTELLDLMHDLNNLKQQIEAKDVIDDDTLLNGVPVSMVIYQADVAVQELDRTYLLSGEVESE